MEHETAQPSFRRSRVLRWLTRLWREWTVESSRPIAPAFAKPKPNAWNDELVTAAWLGHATVLINFFGTKIVTDPALFPRIGIRLPGLTLGPKRLISPALTFDELPKIDIILLSHAHFDHFDLRTLRQIARLNRGTGFQSVNRRSGWDHRQDAAATKVITAPRTRDLLRWTRLRDITELHWGEGKVFETVTGKIEIIAFAVKHWGARVQRDDYRGYNGYLVEGNGRRIIFSGDSAFGDHFRPLHRYAPIDLAIMPIGCYNPWIRSHCTPEQAIEMANDAGARFIMPIHHQTFRLSFEPSREPIERFQAALRNEPERIALREIGETFVLPM
jgi:L-ascorbate metabolism protein UlaG (beta-lactamase superfamily)